MLVETPSIPTAIISAERGLMLLVVIEGAWGNSGGSHRKADGLLVHKECVTRRGIPRQDNILLDHIRKDYPDKRIAGMLKVL